MGVQYFCIPPGHKLDFTCKNGKSSTMKRVGGLNRDCCRVLTTMSCVFIVVTQQAPVRSTRRVVAYSTQSPIITQIPLNCVRYLLYRYLTVPSPRFSCTYQSEVLLISMN